MDLILGHFGKRLKRSSTLNASIGDTTYPFAYALLPEKSEEHNLSCKKCYSLSYNPVMSPSWIIFEIQRQGEVIEIWASLSRDASRVLASQHNVKKILPLRSKSGKIWLWHLLHWKVYLYLVGDKIPKEDGLLGFVKYSQEIKLNSWFILTQKFQANFNTSLENVTA